MCFFQSLANAELILLITPATFWLCKDVSQYWSGCSLCVVNSKHDTLLADLRNRLNFRLVARGGGGGGGVGAVGRPTQR